MTTPARKQYLRIKADHKEEILLFRMGDFYETFDDDAKLLSKELDIALTSREMGKGQRIPLAGIPYHSLEPYLSKLIKRGHRVAICEQTEDPLEARKRGAKSVVSREVVRIITPGTLTEDDLLEHNLNNYLAAIYCSATECSLAWLDLSTGAFLVQTIDFTNVGTVLSRIEPSEILITENSLASCDLFATSGPWKNLFTFVPAQPCRDGTGMEVLQWEVAATMVAKAAAPGKRVAGHNHKRARAGRRARAGKRVVALEQQSSREYRMKVW